MNAAVYRMSLWLISIMPAAFGERSVRYLSAWSVEIGDNVYSMSYTDTGQLVRNSAIKETMFSDHRCSHSSLIYT